MSDKLDDALAGLNITEPLPWRITESLKNLRASVNDCDVDFRSCSRCRDAIITYALIRDMEK